MGTAIRKTISLALLYLLCNGCADHRCKEKVQNLYLDPSYLAWFENCGSGTFKPAESTKGLTESLYVDQFKGASMSGSQPSYPFITYNRQENSLYYNSDLYNFQFSFQIIQEQDNPYLTCQVFDSKANPDGWVRMRYNLVTGKAYPITVQTRNSFDSVTSYLTGLNIVDSIILPRKTYYNVYKISNE